MLPNYGHASRVSDLKLSQQPEKPLGKYGRMRKAYLKEHRPILYNQMLLSEKLYPHLLAVSYTHLDVYKRQSITRRNQWLRSTPTIPA